MSSEPVNHQFDTLKSKALSSFHWEIEGCDFIAGDHKLVVLRAVTQNTTSLPATKVS
jgi:hypothetical protein